MNPHKPFVRAYAFLLVTGLFSLIFTLVIPSEAASAVWMGVSRERLAIFGVQGFLLLVFGVGGILVFRHPDSSWIKKGLALIKNPSHYFVIRNCLLGLALFFSLAFFYVTIFIPQALSAISGWLVIVDWTVYSLFRCRVEKPSDRLFNQHDSLFPNWNQVPIQKKRILLVLLILGALYFCAFIPLNLKGAETPHDFLVQGGDEYVMYPVVVKMLSHQENIRFVFYRFFNYGDYIYGFPFYGLSALLLVPSKLIFQAEFANQTQWNLLILRQLVSVLPAILSALLFTYLATRFKKAWAAVGIFLLLLTLPGMISYNTRFWHPDSLNLLFIALTLYFLQRDRLKFGSNFFMAAITCGLSVATRLFGLFFFLAVFGLLAAGCIQKILTLKKAVLWGFLFALLMGGTIMAANPYLFNPGEYASLQRLFEKKQVDLSQGYSEPDPEGVYQTGVKAWWPYMTRGYGNGVTLGFLGLSTIVGMFAGKSRHFYRILFAWLLVVGVYLIFLVAVKSSQYLLPFVVPLYCAAQAIPEFFLEIQEKISRKRLPVKRVESFSTVLVAGVGLFQLAQNIQWMLSHSIGG